MFNCNSFIFHAIFFLSLSLSLSLIFFFTPVVQRKSIMGYHEKLSNFLKITMTLPTQVPAARSILSSGEFQLPPYTRNTYLPYEADLPFVLRFMVDMDIVGMSWLRMPAGAYRVARGASKTSHSQIEVDIAFDKLV